MRFTAPASRSLAVPGERLLLAGTGHELPVSAERDVIDFKWVAAG